MTNLTNSATVNTKHGYSLSQIQTLSARVLLALIFVLSGLSKIAAPDMTQGYMKAMGVPSALFYPTVAFEIGAGLLVILGFKTRIVAILLAAFCVVSALVFHADFGDQMQTINFLKNLSMVGGFLLLAQVGAGRISLDGQQR
jgi:uncharacterized membrane protein YphA (DoxX/SURF4 family)